MHEIYYNYHVHLFFQQDIILGVICSGNCYSRIEIFSLGKQKSHEDPKENKIDS